MNQPVETWEWIALTIVNTILLALTFWLDRRRNRRVVVVASMWRMVAETLDTHAKTLPDDIEKALVLARANERVKCALELLWMFGGGVKPPWIDQPDPIASELATSPKDEPNVSQPLHAEHEREPL